MTQPSNREMLLELAEKPRLPTEKQLDDLWAKTGGKAWEPPCGINHPFVAQLIDGGWVKICTMRCGFEAFDTGLNWSDAARAQQAVLTGDGVGKSWATTESLIQRGIVSQRVCFADGKGISLTPLGLAVRTLLQETKP